MPRPTPEGERRYPPDGYFDDLPCTCQDDCEFDCRGEDCGCRACRAADGEHDE